MNSQATLLESQPLHSDPSARNAVDHTSVSFTTASSEQPAAGTSRLDYLDATRAFALVLGIAFHAGLSFMPMFFGWAVQDVSTTSLAPIFFSICHSFRMETFFLIAGFFGHMTFHRKGARSFIVSRISRIGIPFVVGWFILRPLLVSGWVMGAASMRGHYSFTAGLKEGFKQLSTLPSGLFTQTHLWFLYYLILITALALVLRATLTLNPFCRRHVHRMGDTFANWLALPPLGLVALAFPTMGLLWFMRIWGVDTPDSSLVPQLPVLALYGAFFALGWVFHRQTGLIASFARPTVFKWLIAAVSIPATIYLTRFQMDPADPHYRAAHLGFIAAYALMMWSLVALLIGVFHRVCQKPRAWIRYLADSSYWLYLVHLPIVVWLQVAVADLEMHWSIKFVGICAATLVVSLATYDLFVRSTFIGLILNGRRSERVLFGRRMVAQGSVAG